MATTEGYNGAYTGQQIDAAIGKINDAVTVPGGGTMQMGESLGDGPYTIEVTEDGEGGGISAEQVGYSNTGSGLEATNVQEAIDELAGNGGGEYLPLTGGTMTGPLTLSGLPTSENHAANKQYVDDKAPKSITVTLTAAGWPENTQTVTVSGVLADEAKQAIQIAPKNKADADNWISGGLWCTAQGANSLTFTCDTQPTQDIHLNVMLQGVQPA